MDRHNERKTYQSALELKADADGTGAFRATFATLNTIDRDGDVTLPGAFTAGQPVRIARWGHNWSDLPVGKGTINANGERAWVDGHFFLDTQGGADTYRTVKQLGGLQEWSYGFEIKEHSFGQHDDRDVRFLRKLDVFEVSPVMLGAGVGTHTDSIKALLPADVKAGRRLSAASQERIREAMRVLVELLGEVPAAGDADEADEAAAADAAETGTAAAAAGDAESKAAIGAHSTGTSTGSWDGPANEARLSSDATAATLRRAFAWVDPDGDPATKAAYKFIHHEVAAGGRVGAANLTACSTGIAVLNGGRSGTTIPSSDRSGVWRHLARHLRDGSREPPPLKAAGLSLEDAGEHVRADLDEYVARLAGAAGDEPSLVREAAARLLRRLAAAKAAADGALLRAAASDGLHPAELHRRFLELSRRLGVA